MPKTLNPVQDIVDLSGKQTQKAHTVILPLGLNFLNSVRKCAAEFDRKSKRLDILFLKAGVSMTASKLTKGGYEAQVGVNHMSPALLSQLVSPKVLETTSREPGADVRITVASSEAAHVFGPKTGRAQRTCRNAGNA
ncbi:hypothetical protein LTR36_003449 [Oleoguttula mirabilis]|uniref:Uncharacterized protein n=1 Tax=Oleoguttula mirabilis TaxID=1507867 RepID=A0AAV9JJU0_9PEZI|nr:hypothetical protein LTR36_003449 [Oleoguttula mirabilis]